MKKIISSLIDKLSKTGDTKKLPHDSQKIDDMLVEWSSFINFAVDSLTKRKSFFHKDNSKIVYLPLPYVESLRELVVKMYEDSDDPIVRGYMSKGNLEYAIGYVKNVYNEPGLVKKERLARKSAFILYNITTKHPFTDGNKRTAIIAANSLLYYNGYCLRKLPFRESERFITETAMNKRSIEECQDFIREHIERMVLSKSMRNALITILE